MRKHSAPAACCPGRRRGPCAACPRGLPTMALSPRGVMGTRLIFGCGAASAVRGETLYNEVNITEHSSFQGRVRLSSHPKEASWSQYHFGSEFAVVSVLNYSLAMDTGLALGSPVVGDLERWKRRQ